MLRLEETLILTAEGLDTPLSPAVARLWLTDLAAYPEAAVLEALARCRREVTGRLTLAAIVERVEALDGRPGPEAAWAGCPRDEGETVVWTGEQAAAYGVAMPLAPDRVAMRMAFTETYRRLVASARTRHDPVRWVVSLGHDLAGRRGPLEAAIALGRLQAADAARCLPADPPEAPPPPGLRALGAGLAAITADRPGADPVTREGLAQMRAELDRVEREADVARVAWDAQTAARRAELREQGAAIVAEPARQAER